MKKNQSWMKQFLLRKGKQSLRRKYRLRKYRTEEEKGQKKEGRTEQIKIKYRKNEKEHDPHRGY